MRVISGQLKGSNFNSPSNHRTHPMSDKIRGSIFSVLGDVEELDFLDPFSGSGAIAIEAISRGARHVVAIEQDKNSYDTIVANVNKLNLSGRVRVIRANCSSWSDNNPGIKFDVIVADPPYDGTNPSLIQKLTRHLNSNGVFVLSWPASEEFPALENLEIVKSKTYGDAKLAFYKSFS